MLRLRIAELMGKHHMKQKELSELTGIRPNTISAYWYGTVKRIDIEQLDRLWKAFGCEPWELFEWSDDD